MGGSARTPGAGADAELSATVNESLRLLSALDAQQALVEEWEAEHGPLDGDAGARITVAGVPV